MRGTKGASFNSPLRLETIPKTLVQKSAFQVSTLGILAALATISCSGGDGAAPTPTPVLTALTRR
jgi:hypothetical protein